MTLRAWLRGNTVRKPPSAGVQGRLAAIDVTGDDSMDVVGESFNGPAIDRITGAKAGEYLVDFTLVRDPTNPYDANAVAVVGPRNQQVGHLARDDAARFAAGLDAVGGTVSASGRILRRPQHEHWNVVLFVNYDLLENL